MQKVPDHAPSRALENVKKTQKCGRREQLRGEKKKSKEDRRKTSSFYGLVGIFWKTGEEIVESRLAGL